MFLKVAVDLLSDMVEEIVIDLAERIRMIIELWGEGKPLDLDRLTEIASNLYGATKASVMDAVINELREGKINAQFYATS